MAPVAYADHANDQTAMDLLITPNMENQQWLFLAVIAVLTLVPVTLYARAVRKRFGGRAPLSSGESDESRTARKLDSRS